MICRLKELLSRHKIAISVGLDRLGKEPGSRGRRRLFGLLLLPFLLSRSICFDASLW